MTDFVVVERLPEVTEYNKLREIVGWHKISPERALLGLEESLYSVCIETCGDVVGFGRIIGDGNIYFYIHDVIVLPEYQKSGLGKRIMEKLMRYIELKAPKKTGAFVGLMIAPGLENFYGHYGFKHLPQDSPAMCMWRNGH